jgi:hypothetical protein
MFDDQIIGPAAAKAAPFRPPDGHSPAALHVFDERTRRRPEPDGRQSRPPDCADYAAPAKEAISRPKGEADDSKKRMRGPTKKAADEGENETSCPSANMNSPAPPLKGGDPADEKRWGDEVFIGRGIVVAAGDEASGTNGDNSMDKEPGFGIFYIEGCIY